MIKVRVNRTAEDVRKVLDETWDYIVWNGEIVGIEATVDPRVAFMRVRGADQVIEGAAADAGRPFDAEPIERSVTLITSDGAEIDTIVWMDKAEAARCSAD